MLLENEDLQKLDLSFLLVVDGLGDTLDLLLPLIRLVTSGPNGHRFRMLVTMRPGLADKLLSQAHGRYSVVPLQHKTAPDVELYVKNRMNSMETLRDDSRPEILDWRNKIVYTLRERTAGDYIKLIKSLDSLEKLDLIEEIQEMLDASGKPRPIRSRPRFGSSTRIRTGREISDINHIIMWLNSGRRPLTPAEIEAALAISQGSGGGNISLLSLEARLRTKYTLFAINSAGKVGYRSPEVARFVPALEGREPGSLSLAIDIHPSEVAMMKHYLKSLCPPEAYVKFGIDPWLESKLRGVQNSICQDPENEEIQIAIACLKVFTQPRDASTALLLPYAGEHLLSHLQKTDLSLAARDPKGKAGELILPYSIPNSEWTPFLVPKN